MMETTMDFKAVVLKEGFGVKNLTLTDNETENADKIREEIGGWLQALNLTHPGSGEIVCMWMDEEGKFREGVQENIAANILARIANVGLMPGDVIVGNVVLTGLRPSEDPEDGIRTGPIPETWVRVLSRLESLEEPPSE